MALAALLALCGLLLMVCCLASAQTGPKERSLQVPGGDSQPVSYYAAPGPRAVLAAPGRMFHHDSWHHLAAPLQAKGVACLCLEDSGSRAVQAGLDFLHDKGFGPISLVGGSAGGAAVLKALKYIDSKHIERVVLLAPAGGIPIGSPDIEKLFAVALEDSLNLSPLCHELHEKSAGPKTLLTFEGSAHAQHMFNQPYGGELRQKVLDFLS
jgi:hypothetical protein